ncbi:hypothetical protein [Mycobacteroides chelonae]|uniref:hypothetical protein n=1 Tax=Mycobacteroides chelonae TaxID=1774 RepID=UPI0018B04759|nr:hypothetical protein [Mycobacteroides chelonae]MBF9325929.1 hypothetical protein [Mycobacteroides chelonae]MBF9420105.1 hypothetical protein [Mycobacteroides chelonae]
MDTKTVNATQVKKVASRTPRKAAPMKVQEPAVATPVAYTATGRGGKAVVRHYTTVMTHAVDVADPQARSDAGRAGLIWKFFPDEHRARAWAIKQSAKGLDAVVVPAEVAQ